jgi:hypothetical protein
MARKEYCSERAVVSFDLKRCIRARYCVAYPRCSTRVSGPGYVPTRHSQTESPKSLCAAPPEPCNSSGGPYLAETDKE